MIKDYVALSKVVSHALRHEPWLYEIELDGDGWVECDMLIEALSSHSELYKDLTYKDFEKMIQTSKKQRHELCAGRIRALYGHSTPYKLTQEKCIPPMTLYHGTKPELRDLINIEGLKPMSRHYVHLSVDEQTAIEVAFRKTKNPVIFMIEARKAHDEGVSFYRGNDIVWLADKVPAKYLKINE